MPQDGGDRRQNVYPERGWHQSASQPCRYSALEQIQHGGAKPYPKTGRAHGVGAARAPAFNLANIFAGGQFDDNQPEGN